MFINAHKQATVLPVPVWSGCSLTPLHSCRIGFFFHHVLELIPYVKRAKGYVNELVNRPTFRPTVSLSVSPISLSPGTPLDMGFVTHGKASTTQHPNFLLTATFRALTC